MSKTLFEKLHESVQQANDIMRGTRAPSRVFKVDDAQPRRVREITPTAIKRSEQSARSRGENGDENGLRQPRARLRGKS